MKQKVPNIRFEGYIDDWELRKLGAITESFSGGTPTVGNSEYYGGKIPFIRSGEISSDSTELFITDEGLKNSSTKLVVNGDVLYAMYGATSGEVSISRINGAINQAILAIRPTQNDNSYLIVQWLKKQKETIISTYLQGGQGNLSGSIVKDLIITLPIDKEEQKQIGSFLKEFDNLITLHQRKLDLYIELKKTMLTLLFPNGNSTNPSVRFSGFTDDWEQRKFEEAFDLTITNNSLSRSQLNYVVGNIKNIHYGDILVNYPTVLDYHEEKIPYITDAKVNLYMDRLLKNGDIIFADASEDTTTGKAVEVSGLEDEMLVSGLHTIVARPKLSASPGYLGYYINSDSYHKKLIPLLQGTKVLSISKSTLRETSVILTDNLEEQLRIGSLFKKMDDTITLHQRKLDLLKQQKQYFLKMLFV